MPSHDVEWPLDPDPVHLLWGRCLAAMINTADDNTEKVPQATKPRDNINGYGKLPSGRCPQSDPGGLRCSGVRKMRGARTGAGDSVAPEVKGILGLKATSEYLRKEKPCISQRSSEGDRDDGPWV